MKKQFFTFVLLGLLCSVGNAWGDLTPALPSGTLELPTIPSTGWKGTVTPSYYHASGTGIYVFSPYELYQSTQTWETHNSVGTSGSASSSAVTPFPAGTTAFSNLTPAAIKTSNAKGPYAYRVTNCIAVYALVSSGSNKKRTVQIEVFEIDNGEVAAAATGTDETELNTPTTIKVTGLVAAKEYYVKVSQKSGSGTDGASSGNSSFHMVAFEAPTPPAAPTFSPASGEVEQGGSITIASTGSTSIKYKWTSTESQPDTWDTYSTNVTVPNEIGTRYLYAYGVNEVGNGTVAHATYTLITPKTPVTLSFGAITSFDVDSDEDFEEPTLTISPNVSAISDNITYSISNSGSNASINSSTGVVSLGSKTGTATVTATFDGDEDYREAEASYTINITEAPLRTIRISDENLTPTSSWDSQNSISGGSSTISCTANFVWENSAAKFKNNSITIATEDNTKRLKKVEIYFNTADKQHPTASSQLTLTSGGGSLSMNDANTIASWEDNSLTKTVKSITINYTNNGNSAYINDVKVTYWDTAGDEAEVLISSVGWATLTCSCPLDFSGVSTLHAYLVTGHSGTAISKEEMTGTVPANTPLLLNGTTAIIPVAVSSSTDVSANKLQAGTGAAVSAEANKTKYVLGAVNDVATFLKINATPATVPVGKAYLEFDEEIASAPSALRLVDEENNATNIENINDNNQAVKFIENGQLLIRKDGVVYDTMGRKIR